MKARALLLTCQAPKLANQPGPCGIRSVDYDRLDGRYRYGVFQYACDGDLRVDVFFHVMKIEGIFREVEQRAAPPKVWCAKLSKNRDEAVGARTGANQTIEFFLFRGRTEMLVRLGLACRFAPVRRGPKEPKRANFPENSILVMRITGELAPRPYLPVIKKETKLVRPAKIPRTEC